MMETGITLSSRNVKESHENDFVRDFLKANRLFEDKNLDYCILTETITESGIPDIIVVSWEKDNLPKWNPTRRTLEKNDLKILHFIATKRSRGVSYRTIEKKLGFTEKQILQTIRKLEGAELIIRSDNKVVIKDIERNFFLKNIIAIEAKLKNWKKVVEQATLNMIFSSKSYILIPEHRAKNTNYFDHLSELGLITFDGKQVKVTKKAKSNQLPVSYHSWLINEHIVTKLTNGRKFKI